MAFSDWCVSPRFGAARHAECKWAGCTCDCGHPQWAENPPRNKGIAVESEVKRGPDRANESDPLATVSTTPKGA